MPREIGVLTAVSFAVAVGFGIVAPALPIFASEFGVGKTAAGAVISAFALTRFVSAQGGGRLVDRFGERIILGIGIGIVAVSSLLAGLAQSYIQLLVLRGIGGVGSAMFTVGSFSLVLRTVGPELRGRATGVYQSGFLIGGVSGPALGGLLIGVSIRAPFFIYAGTLAVAGAIAMVFLRRTQLHERTPTGESRVDGETPARMPLRAALRSSAYRAALVMNLGTGWALLGIRSALIPLFVVGALHADPVWVGVGFVIVSCVQGVSLLPVGRFVDTRGRLPAMVGGGLLAAGSMVLLMLTPSLPFYLVAMALLGFAASLLSIAPGAIVGDVVQGRGGTVVAAYQMSRDLGAITGPLAAGALADRLSYGAAFGVTAAVLAAAAALAATSTETRRATRTTEG